MSGAVFEVERPRGGLLRRRRANRRISVRSRSPVLWIAGVVSAIGRSALRLGRSVARIAILVVAVVASIWGIRLGVEHLVASPRFALRAIEFAGTTHVGQAEVSALAGVSVGDRLLGVDTDAVAGRIATHPWVKSVRVSRRLPGCLVIDVTERQAVAAVALAGLYLIDEAGRPFKRATMEEADGLPVLTGIDRARFAEMGEVSQAAFREALALLREYREKPGRPTVGEISIEPGFGFSLLLFEGGAEIRLGRGNYGKKLAQLDQILEAVRAKDGGGLAALRIVHLDLPESGRVPVLLRGSQVATAKPAPVKIAKN